MTQAQHTPGPWGEDDRKVILLRGASWLGFAHWDDETAIANARLIAAAPDLLEALRGLIYGADDVTRDRARQRGIAAIAKAEDRND